MRDWLAQRVTAVVMVAYTATLLITFLTGQNFTYEGWAGMFSQQWFKLISLLGAAFISSLVNLPLRRLTKATRAFAQG